LAPTLPVLSGLDSDAQAAPMTASVSESLGGSQRPAPSAPAWPVSWADDEPVVTVVVRCGPVVRGPDVALMWPSGPELGRRVPARRPGPDAPPMTQVRSGRDRPLLTVRDRQLPLLRARGGHGRRGRSWRRRSDDGHKLNWRVRPVHCDHLSRWQVAGGDAAVSSIDIVVDAEFVTISGRWPGTILPVRQKACAGRDCG
jgi:hypothetical protein